MTAGRHTARKAVPSAGIRVRAARSLGAAWLRAAGFGRRLGRDQAAMAAVEWGLILPLLLGLTIGVIEMGRVWFAYNTVSQAAMEGVRYAIVNGAASGTPASSGDIREFVKGRLTGLDPAAASVAVTWDPNNHPGYSVTVQVDYDFDFFALSLGSLTLSRASTMVISW